MHRKAILYGEQKRSSAARYAAKAQEAEDDNKQADPPL